MVKQEIKIINNRKKGNLYIIQKKGADKENKRQRSSSFAYLLR